MGVITPDGVVGKVIAAYPDTAQVLLLTDRESGVGARLEKSRVAGVVRGTGEAVVRLEYVINDQEVAAGETIVTSGQDQIFPGDLPVGTVIEAKTGSPFKAIRVRPAAHLDSLEEVFILLSRQEWATKEPETARENPPAKGTPKQK
jgi:rod shape-determining protein MreC